MLVVLRSLAKLDETMRDQRRDLLRGNASMFGSTRDA